jgi:hypothetical protein
VTVASQRGRVMGPVAGGGGRGRGCGVAEGATEESRLRERDNAAEKAAAGPGGREGWRMKRVCDGTPQFYPRER